MEEPAGKLLLDIIFCGFLLELMDSLLEMLPLLLLLLLLLLLVSLLGGSSVSESSPDFTPEVELRDSEGILDSSSA